MALQVNGTPYKMFLVLHFCAIETDTCFSFHVSEIAINAQLAVTSYILLIDFHISTCTIGLHIARQTAWLMKLSIVWKALTQFNTEKKQLQNDKLIVFFFYYVMLGWINLLLYFKRKAIDFAMMKLRRAQNTNK